MFLTRVDHKPALQAPFQTPKMKTPRMTDIHAVIILPVQNQDRRADIVHVVNRTPEPVLDVLSVIVQRPRRAAPELQREHGRVARRDREVPVRAADRGAEVEGRVACDGQVGEEAAGGPAGDADSGLTLNESKSAWWRRSVLQAH